MIEVPTSNPASPKIKYVSATGWKKGVGTRLDNDRKPIDMLSVTEDVMLQQDGTVGPRPGLKEYSIQPANTVIGGPYEYADIDGTTVEKRLIWAENDSGTGKIYTAKDGDSTGTLVTGGTYSTAVRTYFEQVAGVVLITNGSDNLSYMDISTATITTFSALSTPSITSVTETGLTGSLYTYYYRVSAVNVGETAASVVDSEDVVKDHTLWDGTTEKIEIEFPRITGAVRYNIYRGTEAGYEYWLDTIVDPGSGTDVTYTDTGMLYTNPFRLAPDGNSTAGPKATRATNIKGRPYMVGDTTSGQEGYIWFGGDTEESALDFSSYGGGGWVAPNPGGKDLPVKILPFRDGLGNPMAVCLSKSTNGYGKRYLLQPSTLTLDDTVLTYMKVKEDNGQDGTDSPDGAVIVDDSIFYPSRSAFKTSSTKPQIQNIISTTGISDNISPNVQTLNPNDMSKCVAVVDDRKIFWALPSGDSENNQVWVLDLRGKGAWMLPWNISADWMTLYSENTSGLTKHIIATGDTFYELNDSVLTNDAGTSFSTSIASGSIKFSKDGAITASVIDVTFYFLNPLGEIEVEVTGSAEEGIFTKGNNLESATTTSVSGWGAYGWGNIGWGNIDYNLMYAVKTPEPRRRVTVEIDEEIDWLSWAVSTSASGVTYQLATVIVRYVPIGFIGEDA